MKVAVYEESLIPDAVDPFIEIIDCDGLADRLADGETLESFFDEAGKCKFNLDCKTEMDAYYNGYFSTRKYCVTLQTHYDRVKKSPMGKDEITCPRCKGKGDIPESEFNWILCPRCKGSGRIKSSTNDLKTNDQEDE